MAAISANGSDPITPLLGGSRPATPSVVIISSGAESQAGELPGANGGGEINARGVQPNVERSTLLTGASSSTKSATCNGNSNGESSRASDDLVNPTTQVESSGSNSASPDNAFVRFFRSARNNNRCAELFFHFQFRLFVYGPSLFGYITSFAFPVGCQPSHSSSIPNGI